MSNLTSVIERPILFSGAMVRAILEGRKTQTRRVMKEADFSKGMAPGEAWAWADAVYPARVSGWIAWSGAIKPGSVLEAETKRWYEHGFPCPYGAPDGRLWVRETWAHDAPDLDTCRRGVECHGGGSYGPYYRATADDLDLVSLRWRPSIHMPRWASRITLEITGVRVERVADISNGDAYNEGCGRTPCVVCDESGDYDGAACFECDGEGWISERANFRVLWDSINAARGYSFESNPWVWAISFRRV